MAVVMSVVEFVFVCLLIALAFGFLHSRALDLEIEKHKHDMRLLELEHFIYPAGDDRIGGKQ